METPNGRKTITVRTAAKRKRARQLFRKGYSYRQIMRNLGYKSTASIAFLLK